MKKGICEKNNTDKRRVLLFRLYFAIFQPNMQKISSHLPQSLEKNLKQHYILCNFKINF